MKKPTWTLLGLSLLFSLCSKLCYAETPLTQAQYDQKIAEYTTTVNATKKILETQDQHVTSAQMKTAFCERMQAYHDIAELSTANLRLNTAPIMLMVANRYIEQQQKSLTDAGMNERVFCPHLQFSKFEQMSALPQK